MNNKVWETPVLTAMNGRAAGDGHGNGNGPSIETHCPICHHKYDKCKCTRHS